jgi:acetolactate synthase-1/3 small subunit
MALRCRAQLRLLRSQPFSSSCRILRAEDPAKPPQPPKPIDDSTSALDYKRSHRVRPPPLPAADIPARTAEEAVTNILYNTPPPSLQPYTKYAEIIFVAEPNYDTLIDMS